MNTIRIEVCVDSKASLDAAVDGGADRIELCSALELGGLTPGAGLLLEATRAPVPVHVMIRPRGGDFDFTTAEIDQMVDDVVACHQAGLAGVVIGATAAGGLDANAMATLAGAAGSLSLTLHRAFDLVNDPATAIDMAVDLGINRILTSGGAATAEAGADAIKGHVQRAAGRLAIMAGGGITAANVAAIVDKTGVSDVHGSFSRPLRSFSSDIRRFGFTSRDGLTVTDPDTVRAVRTALN
ncbi:MAG: copper homeostasis protein CutC [Pseudomonadota bacterium]